MQNFGKNLNLTSKEVTEWIRGLVKVLVSAMFKNFNSSKAEPSEEDVAEMVSQYNGLISRKEAKEKISESFTSVVSPISSILLESFGTIHYLNFVLLNPKTDTVKEAQIKVKDEKGVASILSFEQVILLPLAPHTSPKANKYGLFGMLQEKEDLSKKVQYPNVDKTIRPRGTDSEGKEWGGLTQYFVVLAFGKRKDTKEWVGFPCYLTIPTSAVMETISYWQDSCVPVKKGSLVTGYSVRPCMFEVTQAKEKGTTKKKNTYHANVKADSQNNLVQIATTAMEVYELSRLSKDPTIIPGFKMEVFGTQPSTPITSDDGIATSDDEISLNGEVEGQPPF